MNTYLSARDRSAIPPELLRSTPRVVQLSPAGVAVWVVIVLLGFTALIGGTLTYLVSDRWTSLRDEMRNSGVLVQGEVTGLKKTGGDNPQRQVSYAYVVDGREYQNRTKLSLRRSATLAIGSPVTIRYLPRNPQLGWLNGFEPSGVPIFLVPLIVLVCGLLIAILLWNLRRQRDLLAWGRPALATVRKVKKAQKGDHRVTRIEYEFHVLSGAMRTGKSDVHRNPPAVGTPLLILYDRDDESRQGRYPFSLYRVEGAPPPARQCASWKGRKLRMA